MISNLSIALNANTYDKFPMVSALSDSGAVWDFQSPFAFELSTSYDLRKRTKWSAIRSAIRSRSKKYKIDYMSSSIAISIPSITSLLEAIFGGDCRVNPFETVRCGENTKLSTIHSNWYYMIILLSISLLNLFQIQRRLHFPNSFENFLFRSFQLFR